MADIGQELGFQAVHLNFMGDIPENRNRSQEICPIGHRRQVDRNDLAAFQIELFRIILTDLDIFLMLPTTCELYSSRCEFLCRITR